MWFLQDIRGQDLDPYQVVEKKDDYEQKQSQLVRTQEQAKQLAEVGFRKAERRERDGEPYQTKQAILYLRQLKIDQESCFPQARRFAAEVGGQESSIQEEGY